MMRAVAVTALVGACAAQHPRIEWGVRQENHVLSKEGMCATTRRVRVVDAQQRPVPGAEITVRQTVHMSAPSTVHVTTIYETEPAITGPDGVALTCEPARVPPRNEHEMFTSYTGEIVAKAGARTGTIGAPFTDPIVLAP
jgi:hypothetical protein